MNNTKMRNFCLQLLNSETEKEVIKVLSEAGYWDDTSVWAIFGDKENNFSVIGNQKEDPVDALVEKFVNSVDAVLTNECLWKSVV